MNHVAAVVSTLAEVCTFDDLVEHALPMLEAPLRATVLSAYRQDPSGRIIGKVPNAMPQIVDKWADEYAHSDPLHAAELGTKNDLNVLTRIVPRQVFHASPAYQDIFRPLLGREVTLSYEAGRFSGLSLQTLATLAIVSPVTFTNLPP